MTVNGYIPRLTISSTTEQVTLGTVSGVSAPPDHVRIIGAWASAAYEIAVPCYVSLGTGLQLVAKFPTTGTKALYMSFAYVAA